MFSIRHYDQMPRADTGRNSVSPCTNREERPPWSRSAPPGSSRRPERGYSTNTPALERAARARYRGDEDRRHKLHGITRTKGTNHYGLRRAQPSNHRQPATPTHISRPLPL